MVLNSDQLFEEIIKHNLKLTPVVHSKTKIKWFCGMNERHGNGSNFCIHFVSGFNSPQEAIQAWLDLYGENATHQFKIDSVIRNVQLAGHEKYRIINISRFWAECDCLDTERVLTKFPLCSLVKL